MAALVQTIPQQSGTVPVLQTRPSSSGAFNPSSQSLQQQNSRNPAMSWNTYNTVGSSGSYRLGHQVVAPYAFTSTPNLSNSTNMSNRQSLSPHLRPEHRTSSAPSASQLSPSPAFSGVNPRLVNHPAAGSVSTSSSNSSVQSYMSKDDTAIPSRRPRGGDPPLRPLSIANLPSPSSPNFMTISSPTVARPSPDRYRRGNRRPDGAGASQPTATPTNATGSVRVTPGTTDDHLSQLNHAPGSKGPVSDTSRKPGHNRMPSADDSSRTEKQPELAKRYRRRSWGNMDNAGLINLQLHLPSSSPIPTTGGRDYFDPTYRPNSAESHRDVSGSNHSPNSSTSSVRDTGHTEPASSTNKVVAKSDDVKRIPKPSPLSQPVTQNDKSENAAPDKREPKEKRAPTESVATQRLAEITNSDFQRPGKSRLRRAFSFGSASELLKSSAHSTSKKEAIAAEKTRRELLKQELGPEHAAIAEQQEASGLGESIYSHHQGRIFNSSTDNLSVSSTASSASVMLRKMGKGMKRSTRSLVGLFRPKSIVSTSSTDGAIVEPMAPQLSVVNIEAERKSVAVKQDPQDVTRGGTVFPKAEPKAQGSSAAEDTTAENSQTRKSIVGGDKERAEVLAAVRKGILKRTSSDQANSIPPKKQAERPLAMNRNESPHSSAPSTPEDQARSDNRRSDAVRIAGEDYFLPEGRFPDSKGASITPPTAPKSLVFSPRIQFHETWPSGEYDRRGDIATCNRLTPLLAQQIKEELNNFKMEMEVHETSKIYTHFL
ncbi:hypothetical protein BDV28DRAFT_11380 [Aspergillus coremiiformis]|uniref:Protein BNI4 n=1 Tax=Aspergillus coremiiformis TaxID=138285 RepID=A0A5N6ZE50_9EURO|nr:hypothetical protein BDV28DRAFT_11380 [Aspergillus coremiiformis]